MIRLLRHSALILLFSVLASCAAVAPEPNEPVAPPVMRWDQQPGSQVWTEAALRTLREGHGTPLVQMTPKDIAAICHAYASNGTDERAAFWVGLLSALSKHESTYNPRAVGGGGLYYGLLQILPSTARAYNCQAKTGEALRDGANNLSCAIRILARTVPRDGVVGASGRGGLAADWGPMTRSEKRADILRWVGQQSYCQL